MVHVSTGGTTEVPLTTITKEVPKLQLHDEVSLIYETSVTLFVQPKFDCGTDTRALANNSNVLRRAP